MRKRLSHADRQQSIVSAAATVFAERGFDGATTKQIAVAAKVSPALLYEHFPSKEALYRGVLRQLIRDQDALVAMLGVPPLASDAGVGGTAAIVSMLRVYFGACVLAQHEERDVIAHRVLLASLAGDGNYARLLYRRARRFKLEPLTQAMEWSRAAGDMAGETLSPQSAYCFIEHVGSMMLSMHLGDQPIVPYGAGGAALVRHAVLFCARGMGITTTALERDYPRMRIDG